MKKYLLLHIFIFSTITALAQISEMDWINSQQKYLKISVNSTGVYKIRMEEVGKVLPEIFTAKVNQLELFHNGKSISFDITSKGAFPVKDDYIYFYGEKNDGKNESVFYRPETQQPNVYSSLYTDVSAYFLTINDKQVVRKEVALEKANAKLRILTDFEFNNIEVFNSNYSFNSVTGPVPYLQQSYFENGEGFTGPILKEKETYNYPLPFTEASNSEVQIEVQLNGRDNNFNKKLKVVFENSEITLNLSEFQSKIVKFNQAINASSGNLKLSVYGEGGSYSLNYIKTSYNKFCAVNDDNGYYTLNGLDQGIIKLQKNAPQGTRIWNVSDPANITEATFIDSQSYEISPLFAKSTYYYFSKYLTPLNISISDFQSVKFNNKANYLIITSKKIKAGAESYANFRQSALGGNFSVETVFIEDLYEIFNFGIQNPSAIKNYLKYKFQNSQPSFLLLIGKAFSAYTGVNKINDLVPSFGYPASDLLLSSGIITDQDVPGIATGRIPALSNEEVLIYLEKVQQHENASPDISQKSVVHLSGGDSFSQINTWTNYMKDLKNIADYSDYGLNITSKNKQILDPKEPANIVKNLNDGVSLISFFGHSAYQLVDLNIGFVSDPILGYNNTRYPVLYFNGCAFNNYFREIPTLSYDWLFSAKKGAIATIGQSYFGYPTSLINHAKVFYDKIFQSTVEPTVGEALKLVAEDYSKLSYKSEYDILHIHQTLLFGDPALKIFGYDKPDLKILTASFNEATSKLFINLINLGKYKS
ncbi:putative type IX secretion system sortase PorU2, partial [Lacihabitans soyangensis]